MNRRAFLSVFIVLSFVFSSFAQTAKVEDDLVLKYVVQQPPAQTRKPPVLIMLHGYGGEEQNMFQLRRFMPAHFLIVAARAPQPVSATGFRWFERDISIRNKYSGRKEDLESSRKLLIRFVDQIVAKYHADPANVFVMGFSQGGIMSYEAGLTSPRTIKGIGVLSGLLPQSLKPLIRPKTELAGIRIFVAHGTADGVLPYTDGKDAVDYLQSIGLKPELHTYTGMEHTISSEVVSNLVKWLNQQVK